MSDALPLLLDNDNDNDIVIPAAGEAPAADPFRALLNDCESGASSLSTSIPVLASLTADLVARNNEWVQQASVQVTSSRSALLARKTRVLGSAKRFFNKELKRIITDFEAADVSTEQLRVWAAVAGAGAASPGLHSVFAASPLLALPRLVQFLAIGLNSIIIALIFSGELGAVATGDGLRVVSAAGQGLKWFKPHSRNEFSVVLAQADTSEPVWLTTGDLVVDILSPVCTSTAAGARPVASAARSEWARELGTVSVVYWNLSEDVPEALLHLSVCGSPVYVADDDMPWSMRVPRRPLEDHAIVCAAIGTHARTLAVVDSVLGKFAMAVSADEKWLVVGLWDDDTLFVYTLPGGELVRSFGGRGDGPLQFDRLLRVCFAPNGNVVVADGGNKRLQEVTVEGVFVRFIGVGAFVHSSPYSVAVRDDVIAVGCAEGTGQRVVLFGFDTGAVTSFFGEVGVAVGQLSPRCTGIRFTPDGSHVIVAEGEARRLSLFTSAGVFVKCVGVGVLGVGPMDLVQSVTGEYVVIDSDIHRVCAFSSDGTGLVRSWGTRGTGDGQFEFPIALAAAGQHLYVMDLYMARVQVFV